MTLSARHATRQKRRPARRRTTQPEIVFRTWGGRREGAGRKPKFRRAGVSHRARPRHDSHHPLHVTLRVRRGLPSLRRQMVFVAVRSALGRATREGFRIVHFSVQVDHVHLMIEARNKHSLSSGTAGLSIRIARAANACLGRHGRFWADRYHAHALRKPREVRNAIVYVLTNWRKHVPGSQGLDSRSSAWWFTGWATPPRGPPPLGWNDDQPAPVHLAATWLGRSGWQRWGLVEVDERPRSA
jgi:putative transposase